MFIRPIATGVVAAALLAVNPVTAAPVSLDLTYDGLEMTPAERLKIQAPLTGRVITASGFRMSSASGSFLAWCIDLFDDIQTARYTVERPDHVEDAAEADLNRLFSHHYDLALASVTHSAAFQVAIWEIVYERDAAYDVRNGVFGASHNRAVLDMAQGWLDTLGEAQGHYRLSFYTSPMSQNLVTGVVPVPSGLALMLTGLGVAALWGTLSRARGA